MKRQDIFCTAQPHHAELCGPSLICKKNEGELKKIVWNLNFSTSSVISWASSITCTLPCAVWQVLVPGVEPLPHGEQGGGLVWGLPSSGPPASCLRMSLGSMAWRAISEKIYWNSCSLKTLCSKLLTSLKRNSCAASIFLYRHFLICL